MSYRGDRGRGGGGGGRGGGMRGGYDRGRASPTGRGGGGNFPPRGGGGGGGGGRGRGGVFAANRPATIDARLTEGSDDALVASFRSMRVNDNDLPLRPDFGVLGTPAKLRTNYFPVRVPKGPLYEYDVSISPVMGTATRRMKRRLFQLAEQTTDWQRAGLRGCVAHDHASKLIAAKKLPPSIEITVPFYDEDETGPRADGKVYILTIKFIQEIETQSLIEHMAGNPRYRGYDILPVITALNLILAAHPSRTGPGGGVMVGRNRFFFPSPSAPPVSLGGGLEAWKGFFSSVRVAHKQLMVNVNVCTTAFYTPGNLADAMMTFERATFGGRFTAFVKGVRVKTAHLGYKKTVKSAKKETPSQHRFDCADLGGTVSVEEYFRRKYQIKLRYPNLPLVDVGGQKANLLPPEVCEILPGQAFRGKLSEDQTANMITVACKPPNQNAAAIVGLGLDELGFRQSAGPLQQFGISIGEEMAVVPGRILPSPGVHYKQGPQQVDERASWNLKNVKFEVGARLEKWAVLLILDGNRGEFEGTNDAELRGIVKGFADMCRKSGMAVDNMDPIFVSTTLPRKTPSDPTRWAAITAIRTTITSIRQRPNLVLTVLSNQDKHIYSGLKYLCDSHLGVPTVCVQATKIRKSQGQLQYYANVALKVNMKLGGVNHSLDQRSMAWLTKQPTMMVGMDVTHPGPGSVKGTPSIAAIVASIDNRFAQFPASMDIQESKKEMITNLASMMTERLQLFKKRNKNNLPARILVYRDGVSEGQLAIVVREEVPAIRAAFGKFSTPQQPYRPKLTVVVCGKRHHTRFFPTEASTADRDGNPRPGTVVDRGVTAIYEFDFFLQAHGGLQGTTRPTHYYVVYDENSFRADELQGLTNSVSYMFARATKAVSLVSPAYYADLACERGRCYLHRLLVGQSAGEQTTTSESGEEAVMQEATKQWHNGISSALSETMFYL